MDAVEQPRVRILLADEQSLFREAVRVVLESQPDLEVVGEAGDGLQAAREAERTKPDVALVDAHLPNSDGVRTTPVILESHPGCKVVVLADSEDDELLVEALEAGASGFLTKSSPLADLVDAARRVQRGEVLIPPRLLGPLLGRLIRRRREQDQAYRQMAKLTRREKEILALIADGADNNAIAQALVISPGTARTHVQNVLGKLGVHSRLEAAAFVVRNGIREELQEATR
ncbi:MAG TPA: response regulator transcription factor [Actinomycetota bacterium]|nr:response regulator transcription factor [Actinomycetota bacterium]